MAKNPSKACAGLVETAHFLTESWLLTLDSVAVVWLRLGRLAALDAAALAESERMVGEKAAAAMELPWRVLTGTLGASPPAIARESLAYYRGKVAANRKRLTR